MVSNCGNQHMPEEVVVEILSRLPVKTLIRFRCVCKFWHTLIRNSTFINKHLHNHNNARLLVQHYNYTTQKYAFAQFVDETLADVPYVYHDIDDLHLSSDPSVISPFNGILGFWDWDRIALWNPGMREFRSLSVPQPGFPPYIKASCYYFGLGLDTINNDYKVVWIRYYWNEKTDIPCDTGVVSVYTLSTDSWKLFEIDLILARSIHDSLCNTYVNGAYYWLTVGSDPEYMILSFDMSTDAFREIPAPPNISESQWGDLSMCNDSIALFLYDPHEEQKEIDIWVMEEECWTNQITIRPLLDIEGPLGFWKNGEIFLETSCSQLVLYNPNTQEIKEFVTRGKDCCLRAYIHKESLISITRGYESREGDNFINTVRVEDFFFR